MTTTTYTNKETNESVEVAQIDPWTLATLDDEGEITEQGSVATISGMVNRAGYYSEKQLAARAYYRSADAVID